MEFNCFYRTFFSILVPFFCNNGYLILNHAAMLSVLQPTDGVKIAGHLLAPLFLSVGII
jgi:hypothetical protein